MTPDEAFLQTITENPDDDGPRLVYADYLEEHGQPERAALIRVQCQLARLSECDRHALIEQEGTLLRKFGREWAGPLLGLVKKWSFHRGFPEEVTLTAERFLQDAELLFQLAPIRKVTLSRARGKAGQLARCPSLQRLRGLSFYFNRIGDLGLRELLISPYLNCLEELDLSGNALQLSGIQTLTEWSGLSRLQSLGLGANALEDRAVRVLAPCKGLQSLRRLELSNNRIRGSGAQALAESGSLERLMELDIGFNYGLQDAGGEALGASLQLPNLKELSLAETEIGDRGTERLMGRSWTVLWLDDNRITGAGVRSLVNSPTAEHLRVLVLRSNRIGDEGARAVAESPYMGRLKTLDLAGSYFSDQGALALADSTGLSELAWLGLARNDFSDAAKQRLRGRFGRSVHF